MSFEGLRRKLNEAEAQISQLEQRINPLQEELRRWRKYRDHVLGVLEFEGDSVIPPNVRHDFPRKPSGAPYWKAMADEHGYYVGGDSAHRVVRRNNAQLHASIPHYCKVDQRQYP